MTCEELHAIWDEDVANLLAAKAADAFWHYFLCQSCGNRGADDPPKIAWQEFPDIAKKAVRAWFPRNKGSPPPA